jgi:hypothetical protein
LAEGAGALAELAEAADRPHPCPRVRLARPRIRLGLRPGGRPAGAGADRSDLRCIGHQDAGRGPGVQAASDRLIAAGSATARHDVSTGTDLLGRVLDDVTGAFAASAQADIDEAQRNQAAIDQNPGLSMAMVATPIA